jgi:hypothetical protein
MSNLKSTIERLANEFATSITNALRSASIDELMALGARGPRLERGARPDVSRRPVRLGRRSIADIARMVDRIVRLLNDNPEGLRAEEIRQKLDCHAKELPRPLAEALSAGRISRTGQKRATTYFAGAKSAEAGAPPQKKRRGRSRA